MTLSDYYQKGRTDALQKYAGASAQRARDIIRKGTRETFGITNSNIVPGSRYDRPAQDVREIALDPSFRARAIANAQDIAQNPTVRAAYGDLLQPMSSGDPRQATQKIIQKHRAALQAPATTTPRQQEIQQRVKAMQRRKLNPA